MRRDTQLPEIRHSFEAGQFWIGVMELSEEVQVRYCASGVNEDIPHRPGGIYPPMKSFLPRHLASAVVVSKCRLCSIV